MYYIPILYTFSEVIKMAPNKDKKNLFNEATRVQMPAMVHLTRLGYSYFGKITENMANIVYDPDTNILIDVFKKQFSKLNPKHSEEADQVLKSIRQELDNDDIGRSFYNRLSSVSPIRLIDFENPNNNTYHFTAEFTCKRDQDEFRPDITLFINGLPLVFVEVKKPNNHGGMVAESKRMNNQRFPNKKFRRFLNITQLMIFSNNMEYDTLDGIVPVQGAFYCTTARKSAPFNCFREENSKGSDKLFLNMSGEPITRQGVWRIVKEYSSIANIDKDINLNTFRHSFAVHLLQNGANAKVVQELLGNQVMTYIDMYYEIINNEKINNIYKKAHPRA